MQVTRINSQPSPAFGKKISLETIKKANQLNIEHGKQAKSQGVTLEEFYEAHRGGLCRIGDRTYDFYAIAEEILSDTAKINKAFRDALKKVKG